MTHSLGLSLGRLRPLLLDNVHANLSAALSSCIRERYSHPHAHLTGYSDPLRPAMLNVETTTDSTT